LACHTVARRDFNDASNEQAACRAWHTGCSSSAHDFRDVTVVRVPLHHGSRRDGQVRRGRIGEPKEVMAISVNSGVAALGDELTIKGKTTRVRGRRADQFAAELLYFSDCILRGSRD
jgi:hypothetical protein